MIRNNQNGYSLVEVLIAMQLFAIVITLSYTIYLYSIQFMGRWEQNNDLTNSHVLLERALDSKFNSIKRITEISENGMMLDCGNNRLERLVWNDNSFIINYKKPASQDVTLSLKSLNYFTMKDNAIQPVIFSELDKDGDKKLLADELKYIKAIEISIELIGEKKKTDFHYFKSVNFPPL